MTDNIIIFYSDSIKLGGWLFNIWIVYLFGNVGFIIIFNLAFLKSSISFIVLIKNNLLLFSILLISFLFLNIISIILFNLALLNLIVLFIVLVLKDLQLINILVINFLSDTIIFNILFNPVYFWSNTLILVLIINFLYIIPNLVIIFNLNILFIIIFRIYSSNTGITVLRLVFIKISVWSTILIID